MKLRPYSFCLQSPRLSDVPASISCCVNPRAAPVGEEHSAPEVSIQVLL